MLVFRRIPFLCMMGCGTSAPTQTEVPEEGGVGKVVGKCSDDFVPPHIETLLADVYAVAEKAAADDSTDVSVEPIEANNNMGGRPKTSNPNLNRWGLRVTMRWMEKCPQASECPPGYHWHWSQVWPGFKGAGA